MMNKKFCISIRISLEFVTEGQIDNKLALVQVMAWRRTGDKSLPEPMLITQLTDAYIYATPGADELSYRVSNVCSLSSCTRQI